MKALTNCPASIYYYLITIYLITISHVGGEPGVYWKKPRAIDASDYDILIEKSSIAKPGAAVRYMFFSKSGFSKRMTARAAKDELVTLVALSDLVAAVLP